MSKTAMQELIELLELNTTNEPLPYLIDVIKEVYIQKEKEQIIDAYYGKIDGVFGYREEGEEYYNQTYNQKQHIIDIMKADEENGLYNQNK